MNAENKIMELNRELKAIKTAYEQVSANLILYDYDVNVPLTPIGEYYFIEKNTSCQGPAGKSRLILTVTELRRKFRRS